MRQMPEKVRKATQGQRVVYWGRRKVFEMVEEASDSLIKAFLITLMFGSASVMLDLYDRRPIVNPYGWWIVWFIVMLFVLKRFIKEYFEWKYEIYAVSSDDQGGGRIYQWKTPFDGWFEESYFPEPITKTSPNVSQKRGLLYKIWGWLTGEQMCNANIKSANNIEIKGKKVDPKFVRVIEEIQMGLHNDGNQPTSLLDLRSGREIERMIEAGLIEIGLGKQAAETIVRRQVWG